MTRILVWLASRRNPSPTHRQNTSHAPSDWALRLGKGFYHGHCHPGLRRPCWEEEPGLELELLRHTHTSDDNPFLCRHNTNLPPTLVYNQLQFEGGCRHQTEQTAPVPEDTPSRGGTNGQRTSHSYESAMVPRRPTFPEDTSNNQTFYYKTQTISSRPTHAAGWADRWSFITTWTDGRTAAEGGGNFIPHPDYSDGQAGGSLESAPLLADIHFGQHFFFTSFPREIFVARLDSTEPG
jgi:hypothetical protein